jgi:type IV pilus assembly protein PilW
MMNPRRPARGVSLVELLVGLAIGLFLLAGALSLFGAQTRNAKTVILEQQLNRNLRQALDYITQDVRRAGSWENAIAGAPGPNASPLVNPHSGLSSSATTISYSYGQDTARRQPSGLNLANADEQFGVRLNNGALEAAVGQNQWQALTDAEAVEVTRFAVNPRVETLAAGDVCRKICCDAILLPRCPQVNAPQGCPKVQRWTFGIEIDGRSRRDSTLTRSVRSDIQVRNELIVGSCPP